MTTIEYEVWGGPFDGYTLCFDDETGPRDWWPATIYNNQQFIDPATDHLAPAKVANLDDDEIIWIGNRTGTNEYPYFYCRIHSRWEILGPASMTS